MAGGDADIWVCGQCRSVNKLRAKQCYHCRTPQELAAVDPAAIEGTGHGQLREIALPEFHASRGEAMLASLLILLVAGMNVVATVLSMRVLPTLIEEADLVTPELGLMTAASLGTLGVAILALAAWAYWLSRVVSAMPALGLGYPAANALMAFVENFIPGLNLLRVPAIVRDVVRRLEPEQGRGDALIFAAWIGLFGGFLIPRIGVWLNWADTLEGSVRNALVIQGLAAGLVLVGAIFLVALIWWIEERIARRRAEQLEGMPATSPTNAPAEALSTEPRLSTPLATPTPTPFAPTAAPFAPPRQTEPTPDPIASPRPFAPTPAAPAMVAGPLGAVSATVAADALLHRPITAVTGAASTPWPESPIARPEGEQADVERFADARPAWPGASAPTAEPPPASVPAAEPALAEPTRLAEPALPAEPAPRAEPAAEPPAHVATGPRLHIRVESGTSMVATLDGDSEAITLDELRAAIPALAKADGSAVIATASTTFEAQALAEQAFEAFADGRVPTTMED